MSAVSTGWLNNRKIFNPSTVLPDDGNFNINTRKNEYMSISGSDNDNMNTN